MNHKEFTEIIRPLTLIQNPKVRILIRHEIQENFKKYKEKLIKEQLKMPKEEIGINKILKHREDFKKHHKLN